MKKGFITLWSILLISNCFSQNIISGYYFGEHLLNTDAKQKALGDIGVVANEHNAWSGLKENPALLCDSAGYGGIMLSRQPILGKGVFIKNHYSIYACVSTEKTGSFGYTYTDYDTKYSHAHGLKYAYSLNNHWSVGLGISYIWHEPMVLYDFFNNNNPYDTIPKVKGLMFDIGGKYCDSLKINGKNKLYYSIGTSIINMGSKIKKISNSFKPYSPTVLNIGTLWSVSNQLSKHVEIEVNVAYQLQKYLVPTPCIYYSVGEILPSGDTVKFDCTFIKKGHDPNSYTAVGGMINSLYDAPNGFNEEFQEIIHKVACELNFKIKNNLTFSFRYGKFMENKNKGNRNYNTMGFGIKYKFVFIDFYKNDLAIGIAQPIIASGFNIGLVFKNVKI